MKGPLSLVLAAALTAGTMAVSVAPVAAQDTAMTVQVSDRDHDRRHNDNDNWRWRHRESHRHFAPGFFFNFGVPFPQARAYYPPPRYSDCWRQWDGRVVCSY